ncbi:MAG: ribosomal protein S18-alanine N-acetyltransferase [Saccharospirillum sp.]
MTLWQARVEQCAALHDLDGQASPWPWPKSALERYLARQSVWLVKEGESPAGFLVGESVLDETTLLHLVVRASRQGRGLGGRMLSLWLAGLRTRGQRRCLLEVRASNARALALYRRQGFIEVARRENYYPTETGSEAAIIMALDLERSTG